MIDEVQLDASIVLPTIGRPELIRRCLESLARCAPRAAEILVVDSSRDGAVAAVVGEFASVGARRIPCAAEGLGAAFNLGLRQAAHDIVLLTNDDCTVEPTWVEVGMRHAETDAQLLVTGRVRPRGDPEVVPSTIDDPVGREYSNTVAFALYTQAMAFHRSSVLAFGGFDGRIRPSAEDNDLSYRWLRAGRTIVYAPDFVAWHEDWRTPEQLARLYVGYGIGQGMVYGKHLRRGDLAMLRLVGGSVFAGARAVAGRLAGKSRGPDPRLGFVRGLPIGLARGWRLGAAAAETES